MMCLKSSQLPLAGMPPPASSPSFAGLALFLAQIDDRGHIHTIINAHIGRSDCAHRKLGNSFCTFCKRNSQKNLINLLNIINTISTNQLKINIKIMLKNSLRTL